MACTYRFKDASGKEVVITGQAAMKAYLVEGGLKVLMDAPSLPAQDLDAMFDEVLAEELGARKENPKAAPAKPKVKNESATFRTWAELHREYMDMSHALADRAMNAGDGKLSGMISGGTLGMTEQNSPWLSSEWIDDSIKTSERLVRAAERRAGIVPAKPAAPRTAGKAVAGAAKNTAAGLADTINALGKLFGGGGKLSSGLTFDEETYAKANPLFKQAIAHFKDAGQDIKEAMRAVVKMVLDQFGAETAQNMKPYVVRFAEDVRDGKIQLEQKEFDDAGSSVRGAGAAPLGGVAAEDDRGNARGGDAESRGAKGEQGGSEAGSGADGGGDAAARSRRNGTAGVDPAEAGAAGRGRRVAAGKRKAKPTPHELKEEAAEEIQQASPVNIPAFDFTITPDVELGKGTESVKFADNLTAIRTLKQIEQDSRRAAPEEQRTLARYVGWGGLKNAFRVAGAKAGEGVAKGWEARVEELESLLTPAELRAARNSTTAAHYTSQTVVEAVWKGVERMGFRGGAVLEPSVGTGNFLGLMPANLRGNAKTLAVEYDSLTARIAQQLYPNQSILHSGFQDVPLPDNRFALAIGNPPFGRESLYFRHNPALNGKSIHNQFFLQSIQSLEANGLMGMVVSHNLMDAQDHANRLDMAVRAEFIGAVRLPETAFKENARTEVVTDILFFRKRNALEMSDAVVAARILREGEGRRAAIFKDEEVSDPAHIDAILAEMRRWVPSSKQENFAGSGETISVNPYFLDNPAQVVGTMDASGKMNARADLNVRLEDPSTFAQRLSQAIEQLPQREPVDGVAQRTMAQFEQMATGMRLAVARAEPGAVRQTPEGALKVVIEMDDPAQSRSTILSEIELTAQTPFSEAYTLRTDGKWQREEDVVGADGKPVKKLKKDGTHSNLNEKTIVTYDRLDQIPARDQWGADRIAIVKDMLPVRDALKRQLVLEASDAPPAMIENNRKRLNADYDNFTEKHGALHKSSNIKIAMTMPDGALALAVEDMDKAGNVSRAEILLRRVTVPPKPVERVTNAGEAVGVSLAETGGIDLDRVAKLLGTDEEGAAAALSEGDSPRAFFDPETNRWEPADGYLSGLVRRKLLAAKAAGLEKNVAALERVQPESWDSTQITPTLGSAWIPADVYADFLKHLGFSRSVVTYSPVTNTFSVVTNGSAKAEWSASQNALSTSDIVERTLNSKPVKVIHRDSDGKTWVDEEGTLESQMKATEIANEFLDWAFSDDARRDLLVEVFNEKFNTRVVRQRDGSHLTLPGKVPDSVVKMRPWQMNAIWRGITDAAVLYDHAVGAGKTYTAIARAMERRRMGLSKKPMVVVPNHLVEQWAADAKKLYPGANILAAGKEDFEKSRRRRLFARIGAGDYDMVIVGHSSFGFIDIDPSTEERYLDEELRIAYEAVDEAAKDAEEAGFSGWGKPMGVAEAERLVKKLEERLAKVRDSKRDRLLTFEEMGVDDLTIDESHEFKNLAYSSNLQGVSGMGNKAGSAKAMDLNIKLRSLRERPGTSVAFLTGTPISNSVAEMYLVLKNLVPNELREMGMENFDAWRTAFVSASSAYEPTESGSLKEVTRLGREWVNMKALMDLYYSVADAVTLQDMKDDFARANPGKSFPVPKVRSQIEGNGDREMVAIKPSAAQRDILRGIVAGFDGLPGIEDRKERNAARLRLMDRARKVSLDARAVDPSVSVPDGDGKIGAVVRNVFATYEKWSEDRGTQLIFLDRSVPKTKGDDKIIATYDKLVKDLEKATAKGDEKEIGALTEKLEKYNPSEIQELRNAQNGGWNAYAEIKRQLVAKGIPANEIRFVQEANTDKQKADLFALVKSGEVRVLIGSTPRMGAGTNVQDRLVALHHVDVTWKPSDIEQREGRIVRQGNELLEKYGDKFAVDVMAYATEMTVDAKMWSLNATKLKAINGIRKYDGSFMMEFDDEESANMAEMAALATGNPLMVERVTLDGNIKKLEMAQRTFNRRLNGLRSQAASAERTIQNGPQWIKTLRDFAQDMEGKIAGVKERSDARSVTINGKRYPSADDALLAAQQSVEEQQAKTESGKGRYAVEINGEKATSEARIEALIREAMGDPGFEAEINGVKAMDLNSAVRAIIDQRGSGREYTIDGITLNGMRVEIDVATNKYRPQTDSIATVAVLDRDGRPVLTHSHYYESPVLSAPSLRAALHKALGMFDPRVIRAEADSREREVARAMRDLPDLKSQAAKTFPQQEELNEKRNRLHQVVVELSASSDLARIDASDDAEQPAVLRTDSDRFAGRAGWSPKRIDGLLREFGYDFDPSRTKAFAAYVRPSEFLSATTPKRDREALEAESAPLDRDALANQRQPIFLSVRPTEEEGVYQITSHEGRHRMMALRDAGVESVPVVFVMPDAVEGAQVVDETYFVAQKFGDGSRAAKGFDVREMVPISGEFADEVRDTFGATDDSGRVSFRETSTLRDDDPSVSRAQAEDFIRRFVAEYPDAPPIVLVDSFYQLPDDVQKDALAQGSGPTRAKGALKDDQAYVVLNTHHTMADFEATLFHEVLGHAGVRKLFGPAFAQELNKLFIGLGGNTGLRRIMAARGMAAQFDAYMKGIDKARAQNPDVWTHALAQSVLTEEVFAHIAEQKNAKALRDRFMRLVGMVRDWLRKHGFAELAKLGESDIVFMLSRAREGLKNRSGIVRDGAAVGENVIVDASGRPLAKDGTPEYEQFKVLADRLGLRESSGPAVFRLLDGRNSGEDVGETVIESADVAGVWRKPTKGNSDPMPNKSRASESPDAPAMLRTMPADELANAARPRAARSRLAEFVESLSGDSAKTFNWWQRTVGSQYGKAKSDKDFGRVYDAAHAFLDGVADFAKSASALAPNILPHLDTLRDVVKGAYVKQQWSDSKDYQAIALAIFDGTLANGTTGRVWSDQEMRDRFGLNDRQIGLYREFRKSVDFSLETLAASEMARMARVSELELADLDMGMDDALVFYVGQIQDKIDAANDVLDELRLRHDVERENMASLLETIPSPTTRAATEQVMRERHAAELDEIQKLVRPLETLKASFEQKASQIRKLQQEGYAPLMRFGQYTVDVVKLDGDGQPMMDENGNPDRPFFGMFETEAEAKRAARVLSEEYPGYVVTQGVLSTDASQLYRGLTPETAEMFARLLGTDTDEAFQAYLKQAVANRSAMKRLINRVGIEGFSNDVPRVLAAFITSNARLSSGNWHFGEMTKAAEAIPKHKGDVKDEAIRLMQYVQNPQEEAAGLRGFLFFSFLGGSIASAITNLTQTFSTTLPYLHQYAGPSVAKVLPKAMALSGKMMRKGLGAVPAGELHDALKKASDEGVIDPQEIYLLMAESGGNGASIGLSGLAGSINKEWATPAARVTRSLTQAWGMFFGAAEKYNRHVAFIAAWEVAPEGVDRYEFAKNAVTETQFDYTKASRPNWARGAVGATLFTFKTFMVNYLEFLSRLPPRERAIAMGVLFLMAGLSGMPGGDDLGDVIDTVAQKMGYNWNNEAVRHAWLVKTLTAGGADFVERGLSSLLPLDVSARLGVGNLVPGTGVLMKSNDKPARDIQEFFGPVGSVFASGKEVFDGAGSGKDAFEVIRPLAPKSFGDLYQAVDMLQTGQYRDRAGRRVVDATAFDAAIKAVGFQPNAVAGPRRVERMIAQSAAMQRAVRQDIHALMARGRFEGDDDKVTAAREMMRTWNEKNPETPIRLNPTSVAQRVRAMRQSSADRLVKATPKEMRGALAAELAVNH